MPNRRSLDSTGERFKSFLCFQVLGHHIHDHRFARFDVDELLTGPFSPEVVEAQLATWSAQIEDTVAEVSTLDAEQLKPNDWSSAVENLKARIIVLRDLASQSP